MEKGISDKEVSDDKEIKLLNEILEQIDNISKENLDKAIKMSEEE